MRRGISAVLICMGLLGVAVVSANAASSRSAAGTWKLDVAKSSYENMAAPKFEKLIVMTDKTDAVKWLLAGAAANGKTYVSSYDGPIDGKARPLVSGAAGNTISYNRTSDGLEWTVKDKGGAVIETGLSQLSEDGNTLTIKGTTQEPNGKGSYVSVFDRVQ